MQSEHAEIRIFGDSEKVAAALSEIKSAYPEIIASEDFEDEEDAAQSPSRMDPLTYFIVAYSAHVTATLTAAAIKQAIKVIAEKHGAKTED